MISPGTAAVTSHRRTTNKPGTQLFFPVLLFAVRGVCVCVCGCVCVCVCFFHFLFSGALFAVRFFLLFGLDFVLLIVLFGVLFFHFPLFLGF